MATIDELKFLAVESIALLGGPRVFATIKAATGGSTKIMQFDNEQREQAARALRAIAEPFGIRYEPPLTNDEELFVDVLCTPHHAGVAL